MIVGITFLIASTVFLLMIVIGSCRVAHESDIATEREIKDTDSDIDMKD